MIRSLMFMQLNGGVAAIPGSGSQGFCDPKAYKITRDAPGTRRFCLFNFHTQNLIQRTSGDAIFITYALFHEHNGVSRRQTVIFYLELSSVEI